MRALQRILKSVHTYSRWSLRRFGVTGPQVWALRSIASGGAGTVGALARAMYLHISTVSSLLDRLERRGLVERRRDPLDRRVVRLKVTRRGRAAVRAAPAPPRGRLPKGLERLRVADLRSMRRALRQLARIMRVHRLVERNGEAM